MDRVTAMEGVVLFSTCTLLSRHVEDCIVMLFFQFQIRQKETQHKQHTRHEEKTPTPTLSLYCTDVCTVLKIR